LATGIVVQIAEALDYAHLKGVVHRDLKPSNVMVLEDGTAKVMDYGIARARRFEGLTVTGSFLGSPEYVAPKPSKARHRRPQRPVLAGSSSSTRPSPAAGPSTRTPPSVSCASTSPRPLPAVAAPRGRAPELERIVLRLLDKHAEQRHAGAEELVLELRDFLNRAPDQRRGRIFLRASG
jgi:serine/threonine-protein kinase